MDYEPQKEVPHHMQNVIRRFLRSPMKWLYIIAIGYLRQLH
ncbi:MAG: hypothetical protein QXH93_05135 [Conexivisphaerales archaeon]